MRRPGILFIINDLRPGGAEMFLLRLGMYLKESYSIHILTINQGCDDPHFVNQIRKTLPFDFFPDLKRQPPVLLDWFFWKMNALWHRFGKRGQYVVLRDFWNLRRLKKELQRRNIRAVNSSGSPPDYVASTLFKRKLGLPFILTMHSSYNPPFWSVFGGPDELRETCTEIFSAADEIFYTADENLEIFKFLKNKQIKRPEKQYLGYELDLNLKSREQLGIPKDTFVVSMMARGIEEKGWGVAIEAIEKLKQHKQNLLFVLIFTPTEYMRVLQHKYGSMPEYRFLSFVSNPASWLANSDCFILPSQFPESLPYAIIEALGVGTPVIASPVAEIPKMLESEQGLAGALIECDAMGRPSAERLAYHLNRLATEPDLRQALSKNAHLAFQKFSMENCGKRYKFAFDALIDAK